MKKVLLIFLIVFLSPLLSGADTVILKNGMRFEADKIWQEGNEIKCFRNGIVIGFSKDDVERIDRTANQMPQAEPPHNEIKKRFKRIQKELDLAYQTLLKEFEQLETEKKRLKPATTTIKYNERVLRYYQNLKDYERKRKAFNNEVEVYKTRAEKESYKQLFDDENFSMLLKGWLNSPVDNFIDLWGYADKIIKISDGNRQYLFVIEVTPFFTRKILFLTNPAGKIIEFRTDVEKISNALQ